MRCATCSTRGSGVARVPRDAELRSHAVIGPAIVKSRSIRILLCAGALVVVGASLWLSWTAGELRSNMHLHQAASLLHGQLTIPEKVWDAAVYRGQYYVPFPPLPSFLLVPLVALLGASPVAVVILACGVTIASVLTMLRLLGLVGLNPPDGRWLAIGFFLGTAYWFTFTQAGGVWYLGQLVGICFLLLAIHAAVSGASLRAGLFLGCAFLSRQLMIYSAIVLAAILWTAPSEGRARAVRRVAAFGLVVVGFVLFSFYWNWLRFGSPFDTGYSYMELEDFLEVRARRYGLFHPIYFPFNFVHMFIQGVHLTFDPPGYLWGIDTDKFGTSLTFASPFLFVALLARWSSRVRLTAAWASTLLTLCHMLFYYNNGWVQVNAQRFALDFIPLLVVLVALGIRRVPAAVWKTAVVYSVGLNALLLVGVPVLRLLPPVIRTMLR
jgi:hypothetical protein